MVKTSILNDEKNVLITMESDSNSSMKMININKAMVQDIEYIAYENTRKVLITMVSGKEIKFSKSDMSIEDIEKLFKVLMNLE